MFSNLKLKGLLICALCCMNAPVFADVFPKTKYIYRLRRVGYEVLNDNYRMSDGSRDSVELLIPCCRECREKALENGVDMVSLRKNVEIRETISNDARFSEQWILERVKKEEENVKR